MKLKPSSGKVYKFYELATALLIKYLKDLFEDEYLFSKFQVDWVNGAKLKLFQCISY